MGGEQEKEEGGRGRKGGRGEREKKVLTTIFIVKRYDEVIHSSHLFLPIRSVYRGGDIFVPISDKKHEPWSGEVKCHRRSRGGTRH